MISLTLIYISKVVKYAAELGNSPAKKDNIFMSFGNSVILNSTLSFLVAFSTSKMLLSKYFKSLTRRLKNFSTVSEFSSTFPPNRKNCFLLLRSLSPTFRNETNMGIPTAGAPSPPIASANKTSQDLSLGL